MEEEIKPLEKPTPQEVTSVVIVVVENGEEFKVINNINIPPEAGE